MHEDGPDEASSAPGEDDTPARPEGGGATRARPEVRRRWTAHLLIAAVVAPILIVALLAGGYVAYLDHIVKRNVHQSQLLPEDDPNAPQRRSGAGIAENYLVVGLDRRPGATDEDVRADVIIWLHVDKDRRRIDLIHFPRDYAVAIPGHGRDKLNTAFRLGGTPLLVRTLQPLMSTPIDHVAVSDFEGFSKMTNAIGGLDVDIPEDIASPQFPAGRRHLDGDAALTFVRERHALDQQDISRGKRQELYLKTLMLRVLSNDVLNDPVTFAKFVDAGTQNLTLDQDFPTDQLRDKAFELRGVRGDDIHVWSAPWLGAGDERALGALVYPNPWLLADLGHNLAEDTMDRYRDDETPQVGYGQTPEQLARTRARAKASPTATPPAVQAPPTGPLADPSR